jgi:hypothetical protein
MRVLFEIFLKEKWPQQPKGKKEFLLRLLLITRKEPGEKFIRV